MIVSGVMEVISLGAIFPFLGVLTAPDKIFEYPIVVELANMVGINSSEQLVLPFTVAFAVSAIVAAIVRLSLLWLNINFSHACSADLSTDVYHRTLYQPYQVHVKRNSSELISGIKKVESSQTMLQSVLVLGNAFIMILFIMLTLLLIDTKVAIVAFTSFGLIYGGIILLARAILARNGRDIAQETTNVIRSLQEGLGGIRDILLDGSQKFYSDLFQNSQFVLMRSYSETGFIGASPRFIIEALSILLFSAFAYVLSQQPGGLTNYIPILGVLALGAQRMIPAMQQGFAAWASITGSQASLADAIDLLDQKILKTINKLPDHNLSFQKEISFQNVSFGYDGTDSLVLNKINFAISKGMCVGFVGKTGSGKSTMMDLLLGLLDPNEGQILVDNTAITVENKRSWQCHIAHVPQHILLADTTLAEKIAFGIPYNEINMEQVKMAACKAQIAEHIETMKNGYQEIVGERGVKLSGGQRQRIGIARALYKNASILVFDEATSALDNNTERLVMNTINNLADDMTIILIAHRLTTVEHCNMIVELSQGSLVAQGAYAELFEKSDSFRKMASGIK